MFIHKKKASAAKLKVHFASKADRWRLRAQSLMTNTRRDGKALLLIEEPRPTPPAQSNDEHGLAVKVVRLTTL